MNTATHTPGPWVVDDEDGASLVVRSRNLTGPAVCKVYVPDEAPTDQQESNAHLIAAAPEMLAALRLVLHHDGRLTGADFTQIQAAIAHAEGVPATYGEAAARIARAEGRAE